MVIPAFRNKRDATIFMESFFFDCGVIIIYRSLWYAVEVQRIFNDILATVADGGALTSEKGIQQVDSS